MNINETVKVLKKELDSIESSDELNKLKVKYFGKSGIFNNYSKKIRNIEKEKRASYGKKLNQLKRQLESLFETKEEDFKTKINTKSKQDYSIPDGLQNVGSLHPITHSIHEIEDILSRLGFVRRRYREIETDWYSFEALNIPADHPARDEWETLYLEDGNLLTPHTSSGQIREMESHKPPIKMLNIAKTYRRQSDISHSPMFHQFEGLYVDKNVSVRHLKGTLDYFIKMYFGGDRLTRIRPYDFLFTEPSFEVDVSCNKCDGAGCRLCKRGWLEIGGAGMVHPNVLKAVNIDPNKFNGFAFGFGVERCYMMKGGINIPDLRMFYDTDLSFLKNF